MNRLAYVLFFAAGVFASMGVALGAIAAQPDSQAATPAPAGADSREETAIRNTARAFETAFAMGDARAIAEEFAPDAEFVEQDGDVFRGRDRIEKEFAAFFAARKGTRVKLDIESIRFIGPDLAIEDGMVTTYPPRNGPIEKGRYLTIHVRRDGQWKVASSRSFEGKLVSPHEHLKQIEWLVGQWIDESKDTVVEHNCKWSEDGNFLLAEFTVQFQGRPSMKGVQRIGWDPLTGQLKSWVFDSEGGHAEGLWTRLEDRWVVKMTGVRPDGTTASATNAYIPIGPDRFQWTSVDRVEGGEAAPNFAVTIVRKPPQPRSN